MFRLRVAAMAMALLFPPLTVRAAPAGHPTEAQAQADIAAWLRQLATWGEGLHNVQTVEVQLLSGAIRNVTVAQRYSAERDGSGGAAWAAEWCAAQRRELSALNVQIAAANPEPPAPPAYALEIPQVAPVLPRYRILGRATLANAHDGAVLMEELIDLIDKTARGDEVAARALRIRSLDGSIAITQSEVSTLEVAIVASGDNHPEGDVLRASMEADLALISLLKFHRDRIEKPQLSPLDSAAEANRRADAMEATANKAEIDAIAMVKKMHDDKIAPPQLQENYDRAFSLYKDSAELDRAYAKTIRALADRITDGDMFGSPRMQAVQAELATVIKKLQALEVRRSQIIVGQ